MMNVDLKLRLISLLPGICFVTAAMIQFLGWYNDFNLFFTVLSIPFIFAGFGFILPAWEAYALIIIDKEGDKTSDSKEIENNE